MILVALGANLPGPDGRPALATCEAAVVRLQVLPGFRLRAVSRWFATAPVPPRPGVPDYVNGVARLDALPGAPTPLGLLHLLQAIEAAFGRTRPFPDAPRTLDLDLIGWGGTVIKGPELVLPHPRAHLRAFVLAPLCDVAPGWVHPVLGRSASALLAAADGAGVRPISASLAFAAPAG